MTTQVSQQSQPAHLGGHGVIVWIILALLGASTLILDFHWLRPFHIFSGFIWWGMVFFLNFILLPVFPKLSKKSRYQILGLVFPRVFRTATIAGFLTVTSGWVFALRFYATWDFSYFFANSMNIIFLVAVLLITGLYGFHLFLENNEIETVLRALETENDEQVNKLIEHLQIIPRIGFTLMSLAVIIMFIHS